MGTGRQRSTPAAMKPRSTERRRVSTNGPGSGAVNDYVESADTALPVKRKNLEEELQKPAFLRFKSGKLRH